MTKSCLLISEVGKGIKKYNSKESKNLAFCCQELRNSAPVQIVRVLEKVHSKGKNKSC